MITVNDKMFAVPAHTARECATASTTGITHVEIALDGPIMWYRKLTPMAIVVIYLRHLNGVAQ